MSDATGKGHTPEQQEALRRLDEVDTSRFNAFALEFHAETFRAAVILGAAKIDDLLRELLTKCLLPPESQQDDVDELLGGEKDHERPLSAFGDRINAAYRLGLIDAEFRRSLRYVQKIRNRYAHRLGEDIDEKMIENWVHHEMTWPMPSPTFWQDVMRKYYPNASGWQVEYRTVLATMAFLLECTLTNVKRLAPQRLLITMMTTPWRGGKPTPQAPQAKPSGATTGQRRR